MHFEKEWLVECENTSPRNGTEVYWMHIAMRVILSEPIDGIN
jgi:hypothetical protein